MALRLPPSGRFYSEGSESPDLASLLFRMRLFAGVAAALFAVSGPAMAQNIYGQSQQQQSPQVDCSDPAYATAEACQAADQRGGSPQGSTTTAPRTSIDSERQVGRDVYLDSAGLPVPQEAKDQNATTRRVMPDPVTDFQRLVKESTNEFLPIFGRELFQRPPSTFAPSDQTPVSPDYVVSTGDEIVLRVWGHNTFNGRLTVDRAGAIYVPQVGTIHVAGLRYSELNSHIQHDLDRTFRNYELSVNLGQLKTIQVYVLGEALHPGSYTISSLSTAFNALLISGGPTVNGSLRSVQVRRNGQLITTVDLYDLLLRGDKSKDVPLEPGDVLFLPAAGPQVALTGSVRRPAIYEVAPGATVADLLTLTGGLSSTASTSHISVERIEDHHDRQAMSFVLNAEGLATPLHDGDVLHVDSMLGSYKDSVTIRGNLANAGRFQWHAGMKLSDIIPDRESLLTNDYWKRRNHLGIPTPLFEPMDSRPSMDRSLPPYSRRQDNGYPSNSGASSGRAYPYGSSSSPNYNSRQDDAMNGRYPDADTEQYPLTQREQIEIAQAAADRSEQLGETTSSRPELERGSLAEQQFRAGADLEQGSKRTEIRIPFPEIDWSYAVVERLDPKTLRSSLVPFNLGGLVMDHDESQDLSLQPGDIVTILSHSDLQVSQDERTKYIRLEGEFASSGVYSAGPNDTLADVVRRAGGFTNKAYLFGADFSRESARVMQQQRLNEYVNELSIQIERSSAVRAVSSGNPLTGTGSLDSQKALIQQLRAMRATGRIVLEFKPDSTGVVSVPPLPLENGDVFRVPSRPMVVSVVGSVYGQNVFLFNPGRRTRDYLRLAGKPTRIADRKHEFIIRADGSILSNEGSTLVWSDHFETAAINPGDTIVVPEKPIKPSALRDVIDWSQVFSQFAIGAAAIEVIK